MFHENDGFIRELTRSLQLDGSELLVGPLPDLKVLLYLQTGQMLVSW